ncbi:DNA-binding CsgD family transcriptional regulator [Algoriphagus sp. 4150]|uniref:transcriptional regulator n=1 Tax=Algoriphagus sp. 4150 TaxID=2817756 RepID=UPI00285982F2|nr:LuxR C-terminal-related transcriptional regulator [Algoriphagus sp. 4150]MDR7128143.1 DNA-binding CsgD family transcriptional regulator [Algoriphagus sp. 4150]
MNKNLFWRFLAILGITFLSFQLAAQSLVIDSLSRIVDGKESFTKSKRIEAKGHLARLMVLSDKFVEAHELMDEAIRDSWEEKDKKHGAFIYATLAYVYMQQDSLLNAVEAIDSAAWYADRTEDKKMKGYVMLRQGWLAYVLGDNELAYGKLLEALRLLEGEGAYEYESSIYHHLAGISARLNDPAKQQLYTRLCMDAALKSMAPDAIINSYLSMGSSYLSRYRKDSSDKSLLDSSLYYNKLLLSYADAHDERIALKSTKGIGALNVANLYFEFYPQSYRDSAAIYLDQALEIGRQVDYPEIIANSYGILSGFAMRDGDYRKAEDLLKSAMLEISERPKTGLLVKSRISNALAEVNEKKGDPVQALAYYKDYISIYKEIFNKEKAGVIQQLDARYQSEKKEIELEVTKKEAQLAKKLNYFYILLILAFAFALFFLYRSYHFRLKASSQQQLLLERAKSRAELEAQLEAEKNTRLQTERELMKERLERLERELLAGTLHAEEKNRLVDGLRARLLTLDREDPLHRQLEKIVSRNIEIDKGYREAKSDIADIRPEFIARLQEKSKQTLTRLDLKYCSYILMGQSNKEIAARLNVDPKSIRMARYRIKQKLNLEKEQTLDQYITELGSAVNRSVDLQ